MGTWLLYIAGATLMTLMVQRSAGQHSNMRAKIEAESRDRFNFFDIELIKAVASSQSGNLLLSPACIKATLGMVLEGARGNSAKQMKEALRLPDDDKDIRQQFNSFLNSLRVNQPPNVVDAANQIFVAKGIALQPTYQSALKQYYNAETEWVDFAIPVYAAQSINRWVNIFTHGHIPSLVDAGKISSNTKLMLASAMYFKGKWMNAFDRDRITQNCFYVQAEQCFYTNYMETANMYNYAYVGSLHAHAVEVLYEGGRFSMLLLLPTKRNAVHQLTRDLSHATLHNIVSSLEATDVLISLPRFNIDFNTDLTHTLGAIGIQDIFSKNANLTGMLQWIDSDLHITNFLHKAKIEVNEEGTIAAAATGTLVVPLMGTSILKLIFNHPFLFFLRNTETGDILFTGRVSQPEAATRPVYGSVNESQLQEWGQGIFTSTLMPGAGQAVGSMLNPQSPNSNAYKPSSLAGSPVSTNRNIPVSQTQRPAAHHQTIPNNQKNTNNDPSLTSFPSHQPYPQSNINSANRHASNPDTTGQNIRGGSYVSAVENGQGKSNRIYIDRIQFSP